MDEKTKALVAELRSAFIDITIHAQKAFEIANLIDQQAREIETLRADSLRYRWSISAVENAEQLMYAVMTCGPEAVESIGIEVDAAIEAGRKAT